MSLKLYNETIQTPEYQNFISSINGVVTSSPLQQKRCTIQITSPKKELWVFYMNGTIRRMDLDSDRRLTKITELKNWPIDPSANDMIKLLNYALQILEKRRKKIDKVNSNFKHQEMLLYFVFDPYKLQYLNYNGFWKDLESRHIDEVKKLSFDKFFKKYNSATFVKLFKIK